jgi:hypothetical protein
MAFRTQIDELISKLTTLSESGKVAWEETANLNAFRASLGEFGVTLSRGGSLLYGAYAIEILDKAGRPIDGAQAPFVGAEKDPDGNQNWKRLGNLHEIARRNALKADQSVSELLSSLESIA